MLRESGKINQQNYNLTGAINPGIDSGVDNGFELVEFAAAVVGGSATELDAARSAVATKLGSPALVTAALIAANFSMLDRVANAIGISLDDMMLKPSADIRAELGINAYPSAVNTPGR